LGTEQQAHERRYLKWSWNDDGSLRLEGRLPAADGALVVKALDTFVEKPGEGDDYVASPAAACRADALVAMTRVAISAPAEGSGRAERCELVVHVDAETLGSDEVIERAALADGPALAPET